MSENEIDLIEAGREMDTLIAERVMGWKEFWQRGKSLMVAYPPCEQGPGLEPERWPVPEYSTNIAAAWVVVEKLRLTHGFWIDGDGDNEDTYCYEVDFQHGMVGSVEFSKGTARAMTAPLAICRAALKTIKRE